MDETKQLLKIFRTAVTDFETEAERLQDVAAGFSSGTGKDEITKHFSEATELCHKFNTRWLDVTQRVFNLQNEILAHCARTLATHETADDTTEIESLRMEAGE